MKITFENIGDILKIAIPSYIAFAIFLLLLLFVLAKIRATKGGAEQTHSADCVWGPFTKGDICAYIFALIWTPIVFALIIIIWWAQISDTLKQEVFKEKPDLPPASFFLFLTLPIGHELIRILVNKREQNKYK